MFKQPVPADTGVPEKVYPWQFLQEKKLSNVPPGGSLAELP
jgi:hypothetical protein